MNLDDNTALPVGVFPVTVNFDKKKRKWMKSPAIGKGKSWKTHQATIDELRTERNIGATIAEDTIVFDLDVSDDRTIEDLQYNIEEALDAEFELDWEGAFIQTTVSGGAHYVFTIPKNIEITQRTNAIGIDGFDLRVAGKGWICSGDDYSNGGSRFDNILAALYGSDSPELPNHCIGKLDGTVKESDNDDSDFMQMVVDDNTLGLSLSEIKHYLEELPESYADDQDNWFRVGMAIYHESKGSEQGWELFDDFSFRCPEKYDRDANRNRWESFGGNKSSKVTFATIIKWVNDNNKIERIETIENDVEDMLLQLDDIEGFPALKTFCQEVSALKLDKVDVSRIANEIKSRDIKLVGTKLSLPDIKAMMKKQRVNKEANVNYYEDYVFITSNGEYFHKETKSKMGPRSFDVKHTRQTPLDDNDEPQSATNYVNNKITCVENHMFAPMFDNIFTYDGLDYVNSYAPCSLLPVEGDGSIVERITGHIAHLLPNKREQDIVINYLAHNVQYPGVKMQWAVVLQGVQGDGKSLIAELMQLVMGLHNVRLLNVQTLESSFTGWATGQCMTFIEELKLDNFRKYEILNNLKPYIANSVIEVVSKGVDPRVMLNTTNYFALTNFKDALPIDDKDRRYCVLFSQWQDRQSLLEFEANNPKYYSNLYEDMRDAPEELLHWLLNHDIPQDFLDTKRAPATEAKESMRMLSKSDAYLIVEDAISEFECDVINDYLVNVTQLSKVAKGAFNEDREQFPKTTTVKNVMMDMGYHHIGIYKNSERKNQVIYCKDSTKNAIDFKDVLNGIARNCEDEF